MSDELDFFGVRPEQRTLYQEDVCKPGWIEPLPEAPAAPLYEANTPRASCPRWMAEAFGMTHLPPELLEIREEPAPVTLEELAAGEFFHDLETGRVYVARGNGWFDAPGGHAGGPWHSRHMMVRRAETPKGWCCLDWPTCDHGLTT